MSDNGAKICYNARKWTKKIEKCQKKDQKSVKMTEDF